MKVVPQAVLDQYSIGVLKKTERLSSGWIHQTFRLTTDQDMFILQCLHNVLASDAAANDFARVTTHLEHVGFFAPKLVRTRSSEIYAKQAQKVWRMQTALPGYSIQRVDSAARAAEAGRILGEFHVAMCSMKESFSVAPFLHDSKQVYKDLCLASFAHLNSPEILDLVGFVKKELPNLFLPEDLPKQVTHGDPKISNFLFDTQGNAVSIVDLDTCNRHTVLVDLGDAFRSWCWGEEDDVQSVFNEQFFYAARDAYQAAVGNVLTPKEWSLIPQAVGLIALELAARFLIDYVNDCYFGWDYTRYDSRRSHNFARSQAQVALYCDVKKRFL